MAIRRVELWEMVCDRCGYVRRHHEWAIPWDDHSWRRGHVEYWGSEDAARRAATRTPWAPHPSWLQPGAPEVTPPTPNWRRWWLHESGEVHCPRCVDGAEPERDAPRGGGRDGY